MSRAGIAGLLARELERRGHEVIAHGAIGAARAQRLGVGVGGGCPRRGLRPRRQRHRLLLDGHGGLDRRQQGSGRHARRCAVTRETARGARRWNDANVLALSLRLTSEQLLAEILDAWLSEPASEDPQDLANVRHLSEIERRLTAR